MNRFFNSEVSPADREIILLGEDAFHISSVLRLRPGDEIVVCDGASNDYICALVSVSKAKAVAAVQSRGKNTAEPGIDLVLFQGIPKADKMELIIQKCIELGVTKIIPVITEFAVARPGKSENKINRFRKIAEAAAKQSGRGVIPEISDIIRFEESIPVLRKLSAAVVAYERETEHTLKAFLRAFSGTSLGVFIGPEGGFSAGEIDALRENGVFPVTLGRRILRTETAGLAVMAMVQYELGL